jgi:hypothetical protein
MTSSMLQSPSWEATTSSASQEIPRNLWHPEVQYRTYKRLQPAPTHSQINRVQASPSYFSKLHFNIILLSNVRGP